MPNKTAPSGSQARDNGPRLRAPLIIGFCTVWLIASGLAISAITFHALSARRPMQSMRPLGILVAPDLKPLERFPRPGVDLDDDHGQMAALRTEQIAKLNSYGWVDRSNHVVHIPIERAMDLVIQRGLPSQTPAAANAPLRLAQER